MPNINEINTAVYKLLKADDTLTGSSTVYKGEKRPSQSNNPSVTVDCKNLERGNGEGIWMCDVEVTVYADTLANSQPDHMEFESITSRIREILTDAAIELSGAKALPLVEKTAVSPSWNMQHDNEVFQQSVYGLVFISFN